MLLLSLLCACSSAAADGRPDSPYARAPAPAVDSASSYEAGIEESPAHRRDLPGGRGGTRKEAAKKDGSALLKKGKELIRKNTELIKTMEKEFKKIKDEKDGLAGTEARPGQDTTARPPLGSKTEPAKRAAGAKNILETKETIEITIPTKAAGEGQKGQDTDRAPGVFPSSRPPAGPLPAIKKLTDLFFKSALVTRNEILSKQDSAVLIESSNKIRSIIQQLQKIYDTQTGILRTFLDGKENPGIPYEEGEKPKDVMKYQVIEVTEKKK